MTVTPIKVIAIAGIGRSGSTLLDRVLSQTPGLVAVGEVRRIFHPSTSPCGCGATKEECPFWSAVRARAFGGELPLGQRPMRVYNNAVRMRALPIVPGGAHWSPGTAPARTRYFDATHRLFEAILAEAGADAILDSSKEPRRAWLMSRDPRFDVRIIHLTRDPRATAASWSRGATASDSPLPGRSMPARDVLAVARPWVGKHLTVEAASLSGSRVLRVPYEAFIAHPVSWVDRILRFAEIDARPPGLTDEGFTAAAGHGVSGNPMRFATGFVAFRKVDRAAASIRWRSKLVIAAYTWPLLLRYGYSLWPNGR